MKYIEHPLFLAFVCFSGVVGFSFVAWVAVSSCLDGRPVSWEMVAFGLFWAWGAWSSGARLFGFKPTHARLELDQYASELMELSYEEALEDARMNSTQVPHELALRRIKPASEEWCAFEKDGISFLVEKLEPGGKIKVTIYK